MVSSLTYNFTWLIALTYIGSISILPVIMVINNILKSSIQYMSTFTECVGEPTFWLSMILSVSIVGIIFHIKERTLG